MKKKAKENIEKLSAELKNFLGKLEKSLIIQKVVLQKCLEQVTKELKERRGK